MTRHKKRVWELDFLRGFAIMMMVFDHLMYDLKSLPVWFANFHDRTDNFIHGLADLAGLYWRSDLRAFGHFFFVALFLLVSGISFTFSKNNLKRGLKLAVVATLISIITYVTDELTGLHVFILFGIIHMFAFGILLTYLLRWIWDNDVFMLIMGTTIVVIGIWFDFMNLAYAGPLDVDAMLKVILGIRWYGADHFGLFPYAGVIMIGTVIGNRFYHAKVSLVPQLKKRWQSSVLWSGRHSLWIFLFHQPVLMALVFAVMYLFGYHI